MDRLPLYSNLEEFDHECGTFLALRERIVGSGTAYVNQCTFCGRQIGQSITKKSIAFTPEPFDLILHEQFEYHHSRVINLLREVSEESDSRDLRNVHEVFEQELDEFINAFVEKHNNGEEKAKNGLINSYLTRKSDRYYKTLTSKWRDEPQLKQWFMGTFSRWFHIYPEVRGRGYLNGKEKNIIIDFVLLAKPELISEGFTTEPMGVEVKYLKTSTGDGFTDSASKGIFQALSYAYSNSTWDLPNRPNSRLCSVMMLSNLSHKYERDFLNAAPGRIKHLQWGSFLNLARHANVGEIHYYYSNRERDDMWSLKFAGGTYFTFQGDGKYKLRNINLIGKERIGNIQ